MSAQQLLFHTESIATLVAFYACQHLMTYTNGYADDRRGYSKYVNSSFITVLMIPELMALSIKLGVEFGLQVHLDPPIMTATSSRIARSHALAFILSTTLIDTHRNVLLSTCTLATEWLTKSFTVLQAFAWWLYDCIGTKA